MKKLFCTLLTVCLLLQVGVIAFAAETNMSTAENDYYREEVFVQGEDALSIIQDEGVKSHFLETRAIKDTELVGVAVQTVYVTETLDENNNILESRLMTEAEANQYKTRSTEVGNHSTSDGKLNIYLVVYKDNNYNYSAYGTANWENGVYPGGGSDTPAAGDDFIAITWGGGGELELQSESISGQYQYNQGSIDFSKAKSDSYNGYCWRFAETIVPIINTYYADYIDCSVEISKSYMQYLGRKTNISLTYIHTYQQVVGDVTFSGGLGEASAGVTLSSTDKDWQIQVDIPQIWY